MVCAALVLSRGTLGEAACGADIDLMVSTHPVESSLLSSQAPVCQGMKKLFSEGSW